MTTTKGWDLEGILPSNWRGELFLGEQDPSLIRHLMFADLVASASNFSSRSASIFLRRDYRRLVPFFPMS
ncbi:MAG: hypothetical protein VX122_06245, partial [Pseudomonadota bacterium]|nr:hypothetical protein [Pseudomonadota bacterium]